MGNDSERASTGAGTGAGAAAAMREVERLFSRVSSYAVFCFDAQGVILTWNPGVRSILGYSSQQFVGRHVHELYNDADQRRGAPQAEMAKAVESGEACDDCWHVREDGSEVFVAGVVAPLAGGQQVQGFAKLLHTSSLESGARLRHRREHAEAENREKDAYVAVLAHELKQPLNAILGWAQLGATGAIPLQRTADVFSRIARSAAATIQFVNDLLDMARIGSGKLQLALVPTSLGDTVRDIVTELSAEADARGVMLSIESIGTCRVRADPVRFRHVISNLVGNAIKYTPRGGFVRVSAHSENDEAIMTVSDTGMGIAEHDLPVIFERFRQSSAADQKQSGLGVGLWVARQVVERHGGTLEAFSDGPGKGATFVVRMPCQRFESEQ
jgi:two-component system CheB/CheR fusion protein